MSDEGLRHGPAEPDPWDRVAAAHRVQEPLELRSIRALLADVDPRPGERVVDVGSGSGTVPRLLTRATRGLELLAVERSPRRIGHGTHGAARVLRADARNLPLADDSVDVLLAAWLLHVLPRAVRRIALEEVARVLRPGGRFGFIVPARPTNPAQRLVRRIAQASPSRPGLRALDLAVDLDDDLEAAGLGAVRRRRTGIGYLADVVVCVPVPGGPAVIGTPA